MNELNISETEKSNLIANFITNKSNKTGSSYRSQRNRGSGFPFVLMGVLVPVTTFLITGLVISARQSH